MTRTKIIATIGPACRSKEMLEELIRSGMDVPASIVLTLRTKTSQASLPISEKLQNNSILQSAYFSISPDPKSEPAELQAVRA